MKFKYLLVLTFSLLFFTHSFGQGVWVPFNSQTPEDISVEITESDNISVQYDISIPGMYRSDTTVSNTTFNRIQLAGYNSSITVGQPEIPYVKHLIAIPECDEVTLSFTVTSNSTLNEYFIYPSPDFEEVVLPDSNSVVQEVFAYDSAAYQQNQNFPLLEAEIISTGYFRDQKYAEVCVYPIQFNPTSGILSLNTNYELTLTFTNPSGPVNVNTGIFNNVATNVFLNYESSGISASINDRSDKTGNVSWIELISTAQASTIVADYLIITDGVFWDPFGYNCDLLELAKHRSTYNGFDVAIVRVEEIMSLFYTAMTEPYEKEIAIRKFITAVYEGANANNTYDGKLGYVLLVGDAIKGEAYGIPASYDQNPGTTFFGDPYPSDYYYSCLTEYQPDLNDAYGDVFIGRFCCDEITQLNNIVQKTIFYETEFNNLAWKKNIGTFFGTSACNNGYYITDFIAYLDGLVSNQGFNTSYFYSTANDPWYECISYLRNPSSLIYFEKPSFSRK